MTEYEAAENAAQMIQELLEDGYYEYKDVYPDAFKAKGGIVSMVDAARNTGRGPMGVASLAPIARNMNRPMVS